MDDITDDAKEINPANAGDLRKEVVGLLENFHKGILYNYINEEDFGLKTMAEEYADRIITTIREWLVK